MKLEEERKEKSLKGMGQKSFIGPIRDGLGTDAVATFTSPGQPLLLYLGWNHIGRIIVLFIYGTWHLVSVAVRRIPWFFSARPHLFTEAHSREPGST